MTRFIPIFYHDLKVPVEACLACAECVLFTNIKTALFTSHRTRLREGSAACRGHRPHFKRVRCDVNQKVLMEVNNTAGCVGSNTIVRQGSSPEPPGTRKACLYGFLVQHISRKRDHSVWKTSCIPVHHWPGAREGSGSW